MERRTILSNFLERCLLLSSVFKVLKMRSKETPKGLSDTSTSHRRSANNSDIFSNCSFEQKLKLQSRAEPCSNEPKRGIAMNDFARSVCWKLDKVGVQLLLRTRFGFATEPGHRGASYGNLSDAFSRCNLRWYDLDNIWRSWLLSGIQLISRFGGIESNVTRLGRPTR